MPAAGHFTFGLERADTLSTPANGLMLRVLAGLKVFVGWLEGTSSLLSNERR